MSVSVGVILEGVVTGITNFGAFVELPGGTTGLVHISEVADTYVKDVKDFLKEKDKIKVKVINIDEKGKIGLSIKQVNPPKGTANSYRERSRGRLNTETFEDKLAKFLKESDEKQLEFRKSIDAKRGGRGSTRY
ncbi:MAG: S1 RNA-binding domain-containing protein [Clostridia bacterium]|nr:S1 RNA-binding domain-containing protein [Clostridia bacterium]MDD4146588.1 S1 RNA-binding domain-containing protein [Clostridia bacterium]MDD4666279.1 S1 RNA-binding domain-containing protein [Clostridia bacterium]